MKSAEKVCLAVQKAADMFALIGDRARARCVEVETILKRRQQMKRHRLCTAFFGCATCRALRTEYSGLRQTLASALAAQSSLLSELSDTHVEHVTRAQEALDSIKRFLSAIKYPAKKDSSVSRTAWDKFIAKGSIPERISELRRHLDYVHGQLMK